MGVGDVAADLSSRPAISRPHRTSRPGLLSGLGTVARARLRRRQRHGLLGPQPPKAKPPVSSASAQRSVTARFELPIGAAPAPTASRTNLLRTQLGDPHWRGGVRPARACCVRWPAGGFPSRSGRSLMGRACTCLCLSHGRRLQGVGRSDPRRILDELTERNGQTFVEICSRLSTKPARLLAPGDLATPRVAGAAALIQAKREGRFKFHHLNTRPSSRSRTDGSGSQELR